MSIKRVLSAAAVGAVLLFGAGVPAQARENHERCENKVRKAEQNLRNAERKHGDHSRQAEKRRRELEHARACR
jgi:hypothetical protein